MPRRSASIFLRVAERVEGTLLRLLILVLLALVFGQSLLSFDVTRTLLSYVDRLEGVAYRPPDPYASPAVGASYLSPESRPVLTVSVVLLDRPAAPDARLLVNGFAVTTFDNPHVTIEVRTGDRLALDARGTGHPLRFRVVDVAPPLVSPREGREITLEDSRMRLGTVRSR